MDNNNPNNKKHSHHGGRHKYNRHRKPHNHTPADHQNEQNAAAQQSAPQESAAPQASASYQQKHNHNNRKNHKNNQNRPQNNGEQKRNNAEYEQTPNRDTVSAGRPARYPSSAVSANDITPEVIFIEEPDTETPDIHDLGVKVGDPDMSYFNFEDNSGLPNTSEDDPTAVEVVGVRFRRSGKVYYFDPNGTTPAKGTFVIVDTARGPEYGEVWMTNRRVSEQSIVQPLRQVVRVATNIDAERNDFNRQKEKEALVICQEKITKHKLEMKLVEAQYTFDNSKLLFYFTSAGRVDFRELVKDLASVFRTRIELRQIGIRDEAKLLGGLGACGRALCCAGFLSDFAQVSIKMAKEQNLSLNSNKISGTCGRLMCCLRYENDTYEQEIRKTPPVDSVVKTPDGNGTVTEINPLAGMIKVKITDKQDNVTLKTYHRDLVTVISRPKAEETDDEDKTEKN